MEISKLPELENVPSNNDWFIVVDTGSGSNPPGLTKKIAYQNVYKPFVLTTGSYANPTWLTALDKHKVGLGNVEDVAISSWPGSTKLSLVGNTLHMGDSIVLRVNSEGELEICDNNGNLVNIVVNGVKNK